MLAINVPLLLFKLRLFGTTDFGSQSRGAKKKNSWFSHTWRSIQGRRLQQGSNESCAKIKHKSSLTLKNLIIQTWINYLLIYIRFNVSWFVTISLGVARWTDVNKYYGDINQLKVGWKINSWWRKFNVVYTVSYLPSVHWTGTYKRLILFLREQSRRKSKWLIDGNNRMGI